MSVLPDHEIENLCNKDGKDGGLISPYTRSQLQPASYDVLLASRILVPTGSIEVNLADPLPDGLYYEKEIGSDITGGHLLRPGDFILGATLERVEIPTNVVGRIEGKSSLARLGITAHITAGYLDPGFRGNITLEIVNLWPRPIRIWPKQRIAQLGFEWMSSECVRPYGSAELGSHYQDAEGAEGTRFGDGVEETN